MRDISRVILYDSLSVNKSADEDLINYNKIMLSGIEEFFLTEDSLEENDQMHQNVVFENEVTDVLSSNINNMENYYNEGDRIDKSIKRIQKHIDKENQKKRTSALHLFNKLINELSDFNEAYIKRESIPEYMKNNKDNLPQVFFSHAYSDKLYSYALFDFFYRKGIYLYVDWMHHDEIKDGKIIKKELQEEIEKSDQLLFMRTINSELNIQGKQAIRPWCSWELGNFYSSKSKDEKYFINLYSRDKYSSVQLHGMRLFESVVDGKLKGTEYKYRS